VVSSIVSWTPTTTSTELFDFNSVCYDAQMFSEFLIALRLEVTWRSMVILVPDPIFPNNVIEWAPIARWELVK
jgi:hypothetical protein